jgi:hypothetical protein
LKNEIALIVLIALFSLGILYNLYQRKKCEFKVVITKTKLATLVISSIILIVITLLSNPSIFNYLVITLALIYIFSGMFSEGISDDGIHYHSVLTMLILTVGWERIKNIKIEKDKTIKFNFSSSKADKILYFQPKDYKEIKAFVKKHIEKYTKKNNKHL